jgi:hypothetical protein
MNLPDGFARAPRDVHLVLIPAGVVPAQPGSSWDWVFANSPVHLSLEIRAWLQRNPAHPFARNLLQGTIR